MFPLCGQLPFLAFPVKGCSASVLFRTRLSDFNFSRLFIAMCDCIHTGMAQKFWDFNSGPLDSKLTALPLSHHTSYSQILFMQVLHWLIFLYL